MADSTNIPSVTTPAAGWFPTTSGDTPGWRLDIVSLLAVIGESSMAEHAQAMTASWFGYLPRIIPAPQVFLKATRPTRMPQVNATVVGVRSGISFTTLNYFPNILHPIEDLQPFDFLHLKIEHEKNKKAHRAKIRSDKMARERRAAEGNKSIESSTAEAAEERPGPIRRSTLTKVKDTLVDLGDRLPPHVPSKMFSPLNVLSVFSCLLTCGLTVQSAVMHDGVAVLALVVIATSSFIVGIASLWSPRLMKVDTDTRRLPVGNVVIRTREGAFIVVECDEEIARELYSGTEECVYAVKSPAAYRALVALGTILVMVSVVLLGNCNFLQQATIGGSYIVLNGLYWGASLIDRKHFWDLSLYDIKKLDVIRAEGTKASFTQTMWYAIRACKTAGWVKKSGAAPRTNEWDKWLILAEENAIKGNTRWDAVKAKDDLIGITDADVPDSPVADAVVGGINEPGGQHAPAVEVPLQTAR